MTEAQKDVFREDCPLFGQLSDDEFDLLCFPTERVQELIDVELPGFDEHVVSCEACSSRLSRLIEPDVRANGMVLASWPGWPWNRSR